MLDIQNRTTPEQAAALLEIVAESNGLVHRVNHNLDGLWLNVAFTASDGDWIASIDRDGKVERTQ